MVERKTLYNFFVTGHNEVPSKSNLHESLISEKLNNYAFI
jgi:hypothetical protein